MRVSQIAGNLLGIQHGEQHHDAPWAPTQSLCHTRRLALVEPDRPLDPAEVVDLGLRLLDDQRLVRFSEGKRVDPAAWPLLADLRLLHEREAKAPEPTADEAVGLGVQPVGLSAALIEVEPAQGQRGADAERVKQPFDDDQVERDWPGGLDPPDGGVRSAGSVRELAL